MSRVSTERLAELAEGGVGFNRPDFEPPLIESVDMARELLLARAVVEAARESVGYETHEDAVARNHDKAMFQPDYKYAPDLSRALTAYDEGVAGE